MNVIVYAGTTGREGLTEYQALPSDLFPLLDTAEALVVHDPRSFPFDSLDERHWTIPMSVAVADSDGLREVLDRMTPYDVVGAEAPPAPAVPRTTKGHEVAVHRAMAAALASDFDRPPGEVPIGWESWFPATSSGGPIVRRGGDAPTTDAVWAVDVAGPGCETTSAWIERLEMAGLSVTGLRSAGEPIRRTAVLTVEAL